MFLRIIFVIFITSTVWAATDLPQVNTTFEGLPATQKDMLEQFRKNISWLESKSHFGDISIPGKQMLQLVLASKFKNQLKFEIGQLQSAIQNGREVAAERIIEDLEVSPELLNLDEIEKFLTTNLRGISLQSKKTIQSLLKDLAPRKSMLLEKQKSLCGETVDLSSGFPENRDQTSTDWCFAYAAADLLSYTIGKKVSAAHTALSYGLSYPEMQSHMTSFSASGLKGSGHVEDAFNVLKQNGYCLEKDFPSEAFNVTKGERADLLNLLLEIEIFKHETTKYPHKFESSCNSIYKRVASPIFPNINFTDFREIFNRVKTNALINELGAKTCENKMHSWPKNLNLECEAFEEHADFSNFVRITDNLKNKRPLVININSEALDSQLQQIGMPNYADHSAIVNGKRWNSEKQTCEFRIRNSADNKKSDQWLSANLIASTISKSCVLK